MVFTGVAQSIGNGGMNASDDVAATKKGLLQTGDWHALLDIYDHPTSEPQKIFASALEGFQGRFGLKKDGVMMPGGPTETTLRAETARIEKEGVGQSSLPNPLKINQPIGVNQPNQRDDLDHVKTVFDAIVKPGPGITGLLGTPPTLESFQNKFGLEPDGIMVPGGPTEAKLNQLAAPLFASQANQSVLGKAQASKEASGAASPKDAGVFDPGNVIARDTNDLRNEDPLYLCRGLQVAARAQERKIAEMNAVKDQELNTPRKYEAETKRLKEVALEAARNTLPSPISSICEVLNPKSKLGRVIKFVCEHGENVLSVIIPQQEYWAYHENIKKEVFQSNKVVEMSKKINSEIDRYVRMMHNIDGCKRDRGP